MSEKYCDGWAAHCDECIKNPRVYKGLTRAAREVLIPYVIPYLSPPCIHVCTWHGVTVTTHKCTSCGDLYYDYNHKPDRWCDGCIYGDSDDE